MISVLLALSLFPNPAHASEAARRIADLVPTFHNFRAAIPHSTWTDGAAWSIQEDADCYARLDRSVAQFKPIPSISPIVPSPVSFRGAVDGIAFVSDGAANRDLRISCELALRLPTLTRVLRAHGVVWVNVISDYRDHPRPSFHTMGLGFDLAEFRLADGTPLSVKKDFLKTPRIETCQATPPAGAKARALLEIACDLYKEGVFSSVLTPNYNAGHRDHFHLDVRPDDHRHYLR